MPVIKDEQESIKEWFNKTYSSRGEFYLRPVKAYYIYLELLGVKSGTALLDVACGLGRLLEAAQDYNCSLTGIDLSDIAVEKAKKKIPSANIMEGNAEELTFLDDTFDYITCLGSLERMLNRSKVLDEMKRVSKPSAKFCFLVRNSETFSWKFIKKSLGLKNKKGHQGAMDLDAWKDLFTTNGFIIENILHDQYPLHKREKFKYLGLKKVNYKQAVAVNTPIKKANEFLFILRKSNR